MIQYERCGYLITVVVRYHGKTIFRDKNKSKRVNKSPRQRSIVSSEIEIKNKTFKNTTTLRVKKIRSRPARCLVLRLFILERKIDAYKYGYIKIYPNLGRTCAFFDDPFFSKAASALYGDSFCATFFFLFR